MTRSKSSPMLSPPRKRFSFGTTPRNACTNACSSSAVGNRGERGALQLPQLGPRLRRVPGRDDGGGLGRARQAGDDHPVELDAVEQRAGGLGLLATGRRERHVVLRHGPPVVVEVRHRAVAHQVEPAPQLGSDELGEQSQRLGLPGLQQQARRTALAPAPSRSAIRARSPTSAISSTSASGTAALASSFFPSRKRSWIGSPPPRIRIGTRAGCRSSCRAPMPPTYSATPVEEVAGGDSSATTTGTSGATSKLSGRPPASEPLLEMRAVHLGESLRREENRQPSVRDLGRERDVARSDRGEVDRHVRAQRARDQLERLAQTGGAVSRRDVVVLAVMLERLLATEDRPHDGDVLPRERQRFPRPAMPALYHLRPRRAEAQERRARR